MIPVAPRLLLITLGRQVISELQDHAFSPSPSLCALFIHHLSPFRCVVTYVLGRAPPSRCPAQPSLRFHLEYHLQQRASTDGALLFPTSLTNFARLPCLRCHRGSVGVRRRVGFYGSGDVGDSQSAPVCLPLGSEPSAAAPVQRFCKPSATARDQLRRGGRGGDGRGCHGQQRSTLEAKNVTNTMYGDAVTTVGGGDCNNGGTEGGYSARKGGRRRRR